MFLVLTSMAQAPPEARLDTATVIRKSHMEGMPDRYEMRAPRLTFDPATSIWTTSQVTTSHRSRGECRRTNGCTVVRERTCRINDRIGRVLGCTTEKSVFPNYE